MMSKKKKEQNEYVYIYINQKLSRQTTCHLILEKNNEKNISFDYQ